MRISAFYIKDHPPLKHVHVSDLSDVVVIAGPNGVGKTRLIAGLLRFIQRLKPEQAQWLLIEATSAEELKEWGKALLDTRNNDDCTILMKTLQRKRRRAGHVSSVLNFESNRQIASVSPYTFTWDYTDPFDEDVGWNLGFGGLAGRFSDTVHSLFRKVRSRREAMADVAERLMRASSAPTVELRPADFPDPLTPFKQAFSQLLAPKFLLDPDPKNQELFYSEPDANYDKLPISALSSGEREVVNIVFDFLLRNPSDCIIIFDEPELHLHPELSYKLLQTLRSVGTRNQFIFCTHSPEIITASLDDSVVFVSPPRGDSNQAISVREDDETHQALRLIGQSIGIVSLGKKIVLIEGDHESLDKQTYGAIIRNEFPNLVLVPSGGKGVVQNFSILVERVIEKSMWGVEFFMLCDRDAVPTCTDAQHIESASKGRVRILKKYHLENYFLDSEVIARIFEPLEQKGSWLLSPPLIDERLEHIARGMLSYASALIVAAHYRERVGNFSIMPKDCHGKSPNELTALLLTKANTEAARIQASTGPQDIEGMAKQTMTDLSASFDNGTWKNLIPGRQVLQIFCASHAMMEFGRYKSAYLKAAQDFSPSPFDEIKDVFRTFAKK